MSKIFTRWIPAVAATAIVAAGAVAVPLAANATSQVSHLTAKQVVALVASSKVTSFSGTL